MTVTLGEQAEELLKRELEAGHFSNADEALQAAIWQAFGAEATPELEALLDEALSHQGRRIPQDDLVHRYS